VDRPRPQPAAHVLLALLLSAAAAAQDAAAVDRVARQARSLALDGVAAVRAQVMVLGTFHFAGSRTDERGDGPAGMLEPGRQREIAEVIERLVAFAPTRVAVEVKAADRDILDRQYDAWLRGGFELGENEVYQIAFRVAAELGHDRVHAIDVDGRWFEPYVDPAEWAQAHGQAALLEDPAASGFLAALDVIERHRLERPLAEHFALLNLPGMLSLTNAEYLGQKLALGDDGTYPGADGFVSQWSNRHLRLYANLLRLRRDADERILFLVGAAHAAMLRHLVDDSLHLQSVSPVPFLLPEGCAPADGPAGGPAPAATAAPGAAELTERLREHVHEIVRADGGLSGPGLELLCEAARDSQFVLLGEPHNTRELPELTRGLFEALAARCGYDALAIEEGPLLVEALSAAARDGGQQAVREAARRDPEALHFQGDGELALVAAVATAVGERPAIWGLDRELGLEHALDRFAASDDGPRLAGAIEELRTGLPVGPPAGSPAGTDEPAGDAPDAPPFARADPARVAAFARQVRALAEDPDVRAAALCLERSVVNVARHRAGEGFEATTDRESLMKSALRRRVEAWTRETGEPPRVLLRFGHLHARRAGLQGATAPLGAEAASIAAANGLVTFHVTVQLVNGPGGWWSLTDYPEYAPLAALGDPGRWLLVDLRPVQQDAERYAHLPEATRDTIRDFDAVLLLGGGTRDVRTWR
jgi:hypothetical protein